MQSLDGLDMVTRGKSARRPASKPLASSSLAVQEKFSKKSAAVHCVLIGHCATLVFAYQEECSETTPSGCPRGGRRGRTRRSLWRSSDGNKEHTDGPLHYRRRFEDRRAVSSRARPDGAVHRDGVAE